jgi:hypothetical protein
MSGRQPMRKFRGGRLPHHRGRVPHAGADRRSSGAYRSPPPRSRLVRPTQHQAQCPRADDEREPGNPGKAAEHDADDHPDGDE